MLLRILRHFLNPDGQGTLERTRASAAKLCCASPAAPSAAGGSDPVKH